MSRQTEHAINVAVMLFTVFFAAIAVIFGALFGRLAGWW